MTTTTKTEKIVLSDGRRGTQTRYTDDDGKWVLSEVVIYQLADGTRCRHIYGPRRFLDARVYSFADLGDVTWEIAE